MNGAEFMQPVFHALDNAIRDYGDYLYMGLAYVSIPLIGWILGGGLRRKLSRREPGAGVAIIVIRPPVCPPPLPPPTIGSARDSFAEDDEDSFSA
jgi:hypothetical protein